MIGDFLDVTFDLPSGKYWPYRKSNNKPLYVNAKSNHPPVVIKHLPMNITERLSSISCNKDEFNKSKPIYAEAFKKSGFDGNMSFIDPATRKNKRKRIRKNIIWFNPPFDKDVTTNVAKRFLQLIDYDDINISWGIEQRSSKYKCGTRRCDLCLSEKTIIAMAERSSLLNRRAEIVSTCRHRTKFRYHMVKKKRHVQALNP